jgi:predicted nucleotidyltransferase
LLLRESIGRQVHYRANPECPVFDELAGLLRKTTGLADVLRAVLEPLGSRVKIAFVYGSVAAGTARPRSDVDVMVIGKASFAELVRTLAPTQEVLKREVNMTPLTPVALAQKVKAKDGFVKQILTAPKIFLIGTDRDLAELVAHRAA